jgi:NAD(P)-dependent dehydrogenase (short-subunit alcohol dehydrogenase family)
MATVLITGAAKRLGKYIALAFAEAGYNIALHCNSSVEEAEVTADDIRRYHGVTCEVFVQNLQKTEQLGHLIESVRDTFSDLSVLVNSASVFGQGTLMETSEGLFDAQLGVNFKAPFFLTQAFAKIIKNGSVCNIIDTYASTNVYQHTAYLLAKKALAGLTGTAARELAPAIRVNGVAPGLILPSNEKEVELFSVISKKLPLKKVGQPEDVAKAVLFLTESSYITGEIIHIDGGRHLL